MALLDRDIDQSLILKAVQQVAVLVQGCWVVKSELLHPKDSFSAYNHSPAEVICRARDLVVSVTWICRVRDLVVSVT